MPMFDFKCACGHVYEELVRGDATPVCPQCGGTESERLLPTSFGSNGSRYEMPPSRSHRKKSAVAKRFGQAFGEGD